MPELFTLREFEMLDDALFQCAADARPGQEEERWLTLQHKIGVLQAAARSAGCKCDHARKSHRYATAHNSRCLLCSCAKFEPATDQQDGKP